MSSRWLFALFGLLLISTSFPSIYADDAADGEVQDEADVKADETIDESGLLISASPDASVTFLFTEPVGAGETLELVAGRVTKFLIGFANRGEKDFTVHFSHTSFRYPMDFSYHVQNFTAARYQRTVAPKQEATFDFALIPNEAFIGRPLGLVVEVHYSDGDNVPYVSTAFNQTVNIIEDESVFNAESAFLILTGIGFLVLLLLLGQHLLSRFTRKQPQRVRQYQETGTGKTGDLDFEWIPKELTSEKKSPKMGSPRQRKHQKTN
jgi:translocon-associated protein subunit alpha